MATAARQPLNAQFLVPINDIAEPELSIIIPTLNDEATIGDVVESCKAGFAEAGVAGEVLIVDRSADQTADVALSHGARVLKTAQCGSGRAYHDAAPHVRGRYILIGDACDFREISGFVEALRAGAEFVTGPHFKGMQGITRQAVMDMQLESQSWENASEMVLKAAAMRLRTAKVPVRRLTRMQREARFSPCYAGGLSMLATLVYRADSLMLKAGLVLLVAGFSLLMFSLNSMLLGISLATLGLQSFYLGCVAQVLYDRTGDSQRRWLRMFPYTRSVTSSAALMATGLALGFVGGQPLAVSGLLCMIGFLTCAFTLLLHAAAVHTGRRDASGLLDRQRCDAAIGEVRQNLQIQVAGACIRRYPEIDLI
jgi:hypothetical protein